MCVCLLQYSGTDLDSILSEGGDTAENERKLCMRRRRFDFSDNDPDTKYRAYLRLDKTSLINTPKKITMLLAGNRATVGLLPLSLPTNKETMSNANRSVVARVVIEYLHEMASFQEGLLPHFSYKELR